MQLLGSFTTKNTQPRVRCLKQPHCYDNRFIHQRRQRSPTQGARAGLAGAQGACLYCSHITECVLVADLCALVQRSEAHFSRSFRRTFGQLPHSFVVRRHRTQQHNPAHWAPDRQSCDRACNPASGYSGRSRL